MTRTRQDIVTSAIEEKLTKYRSAIEEKLTEYRKQLIAAQVTGDYITISKIVDVAEAYMQGIHTCFPSIYVEAWLRKYDLI